MWKGIYRRARAVVNCVMYFVFSKVYSASVRVPDGDVQRNGASGIANESSQSEKVSAI